MSEEATVVYVMSLMLTSVSSAEEVKVPVLLISYQEDVKGE
jgi:hypothetical protein